MTSARITELRNLAEKNAGKNGAAAILECLSEITKLQLIIYNRRQPNVPSIAQCCEYAAEIGLAIDEATAFHDHHQKFEWKMKQGPIRDWKAALRLWKRNAEKFNGSPGNGKKPANAFGIG